MPRSRPSPTPQNLVRAAGAVVWRFRDDSREVVQGEAVDPGHVEVLVVHRPRYNDWSWPKGKTEANEPVPVAAVREVEEETGLAVALGAPLTLQRYRLGSGQTKEVHYWVGRALAEGPAMRTRRPVQRASHREIDMTRWLSVPRAQAMLTRRGDRRLLSEVVARGEEGTLVTTTIGMLRHAKAVARGSWDQGEATRPLTRLGVQQAIDVVDLLSAFGTRSLVSSPWRRCAATVGPYAALAGLTVRERAVLTERAMAEHPERGRALMAALVRDAREATVLCVHRPTLPALLDPLLDSSPSRQRTCYPQASPWLATAELLVSHVAHPGPGDPRVVAVERHCTTTKTVLPD